jgi:hypothetical protein
MRLTALLLSLLFCAAGQSAFAQNTAPRWYLDKEAQYPSRAYIAAIGEGASRSDAEARALAGVSMFFTAKTEARNEAIREFNEAVTNNTTNFSSKTYISESAVISSEQEFLGVRFTSAYWDTQSKKWAVLAYIDRAEAAQIYDTKITASMTAINALAADAAGEAEPLYVCGLLYRALRLAGLTAQYIETAAAVDTRAAPKYAAYTALFQQLRARYRAVRDSLAFFVAASASDTTGRVERSLQNLFEENGYLITVAEKARYTVSTRLTTAEEIYDIGPFVRCGIAIRIERDGKALFSYSKNYPRYGHKTIDGAYNRAFLAIEQDLRENFMEKLSALFGV